MNAVTSLFASLFMALYGMFNYGQDVDKLGTKSFSPYQKQSWSDTNDKWIVMSAVTDSIHDVISLNGTETKGWTILLVGDRESTPDWSHKVDNLVYLSRGGQRQQGFSVETQLPRDLQTRRIIGYLYAISRGAKVIYEAIAGNQTKIPVDNFLLGQHWTGLTYDESGEIVFSPYKHFGQGGVEPRGFPASEAAHNKHAYLLGNWETSLIQQTLIGGYKEDTTLLKSHRSAKGKTPNITFDLGAPPVSVPKGVLSPFDARSTLFRYDAFWAMFLPVTTPRSVSDLYRSYWAQRLLWEIGGTVGFFTSRGHIRIGSSFKAGARSKSQARFKAHELIDFLNRWTCNHHEAFFKCVLMLTKELADQTFWGHSEVDLVMLWINDLKKIGYVEPKRIKFSKKPRGNRRRHHTRTTSKVQFVPEVQISGSENGSLKVFSRQTEKARLICQNLHIRLNSGHMKSLSTILLIVTISDSKHYESIATLEALYSTHFPHLLYCGRKMRTFLKISKTLKYPVTFVETDLKRGTMRQNCLIKAMEMNYKVEGYLFVSDKVLINPWTFLHLPVHRFWFVKPVTRIQYSSDRGSTRSRKKNKAFQVSMKELESANSSRYRGFREHLRANTRNDYTGHLNMVGDIVYIPQRYQQDVLFSLRVFTRNGMVSDHALATAIGGVVNLKEVHYLDGHHVPAFGRRGHSRPFQQDFHKNFNYLYPVDFGKVMKSTDGIDFVCNTFLPLVFGS